MIALHKTNKAIAFGNYTTIENDNKDVFTFMRSYESEKVVVAINLSDATQLANISPGQAKLLIQKAKLLYRNIQPDNKNDILSFELKPYAIEVWEVE
jgi:glycosidase